MDKLRGNAKSDLNHSAHCFKQSGRELFCFGSVQAEKAL